METKKEFIFGTYVEANDNTNNDLIVVKEHIHHEDGTITPNVRYIKNYQRKFYITKKSFQDHQTKKEFEYKHKLDEFSCNQKELASKIFQKLNGFKPKGYVNLKEMNRSPYVYNTDVSPTVLLAHDYRTKYPNLSSPCSLAVLDYETDVLNNNPDKIISGVLCMKDKAIITVDKSFLGDTLINFKDNVLRLINSELAEIIKERNIDFEIEICNRPSEQVIKIIKKAHEWCPDFVGVWNLNFDVKRMLKALKEDNIDPARVFSDPKLPREYQHFKYIQDSPFKRKTDETDNSEVDEDSNDEEPKEENKQQRQTPKHPADLWHTVIAPCGFYFICLMALYKKVRAGKQQRNSYSLDSVLQDTVKLKKLRFKGIADNLTGLSWHKEMQLNHKLEYCVYMFFDGLSCIIQEEKTKDIEVSLKSIIGISDLRKMMSNPTQLCDDLTFTMPENTVIGSTSPNMTEELDKYIPTLRRWIIALSSDLEDNIGCMLLNDLTVRTNISLFCYDIDVSSAYPTAGIILNVSKSTNRLETCKIDGFSEGEQRSIGINLTGIKPNAISLSKLTYGMGSLDNLLEEFKKEKGII